MERISPCTICAETSAKKPLSKKLPPPPSQKKEGKCIALRGRNVQQVIPSEADVKR